MEIYRPFTLPETPPPLGTPRRPNNPQPAPRTPVAQQLPAGTAPNLIPDQTPVVGPDSGPATTDTGTGEGPVGVPWGIPDSVSAETQPVTAAPAQPVAPLNPGGDVRPARVLRRVQPRYPEIMLRTGMAAVVTVHCVIGKDGTIRDPQIIQSSFPPFNEAVLEAVSQWTFAPGTRRGEPVDTYFDLTVRFVVSR
jgi:protein TonB